MFTVQLPAVVMEITIERISRIGQETWDLDTILSPSGQNFAEVAAKGKTGKTNNLRTCSAHFPLKAQIKPLNGRRQTCDSALPTLFRRSKG